MPQHIVVFAMVAQELDPQHTGQAGIHTEMSHFVYPHDFSDLQRRRFKEREIDHHCDNRQGDRIFLGGSTNTTSGLIFSVFINSGNIFSTSPE